MRTFVNYDSLKTPKSRHRRKKMLGPIGFNKIFFKGKELKREEPNRVMFRLVVPKMKRKKTNRLTIIVPQGVQIETIIVNTINHAKKT